MRLYFNGTFTPDRKYVWDVDFDAQELVVVKAPPAPRGEPIRNPGDRVPFWLMSEIFWHEAIPPTSEFWDWIPEL